jgi:4'-phosphopantetheinyl transferase
MPCPPIPIDAVDAHGLATTLAAFLRGEAQSPLAVAIAVSTFELVDADGIISAEDHKQGLRFLRIEDRLRFVLGRASLRCLLSHVTGTKAAELAFDRNEFGKLSLPNAPHFNLSHSGDFVLIGLHKSADIGVDVEALPAMTDWPKLAESYLTEAERAVINACASAEQGTAFMRAWTRKEAVAKALGLGLSLPPASFSVIPSDANWRVEAEPGPLQKGSWSCFDLALNRHHVGALAVAADVRSCTGVATAFAAILRLAIL